MLFFSLICSFSLFFNVWSFSSIGLAWAVISERIRGNIPSLTLLHINNLSNEINKEKSYNDYYNDDISEGRGICVRLISYDGN